MYFILLLKDENMKKRGILYLSIVIAFFNIFDAWITNYGMMNDFIQELNPLMNMIIAKSPLLFLFAKTLLSLLVILMSYIVYKQSHEKFKRIYSLTLYSVCFLYFSIFLVHLTWLTLI